MIVCKGLLNAVIVLSVFLVLIISGDMKELTQGRGLIIACMWKVFFFENMFKPT